MSRQSRNKTTKENIQNNKDNNYKNNTSSTPWYSTNAFKITLGAILIIAMIITLISLENMFNDDQNAGQKATAGQQLGTGSAQSNDPNTQVIRISVEAGSYSPDTLTVKVNQKVRWIIDGTDKSGCTSYLRFPAFGINQKINTGENIIEFMPTQTGTYYFTCGMGMVQGTMIITN